MRKFTLLFILSYSLLMTAFGFAGFDAFKAPHIKNDFCGSPKMYYKNCKCAFHGQFCDDVGMNQNTANNFVNTAYNTWINELKAQAKRDCENGFGIWQGDGCEYCDAPTIQYEGKCMTVAEICGEDPYITFNPKTQDCECTSGYKRVDGICKESIIFDVEILEGTNPMAADGKSQLVLQLTLQNSETGEPLPDTEIEIGYTTASKKGTLNIVEDNGDGTYKLMYISAVLSNMNGAEDYIYAKYKNAQGETVFEKYKIMLLSPIPAIVKKPGFVDQNIQLFFAGPETHLTIVTKGENNEEIPINGAEVTHSQYFTKFTDTAGEVMIEAPNEKEGDIITENKIILELEPWILESKKDAYNMYSKLIQGGNLSNDTVVEKFITKFIRILAAEGDDLQSRGIVSSIKRLPTSFAIINRGDKLATDAREQIASSWTNFAGDLKDTILTLLGFDEWLEKLKEQANSTLEHSEKLENLSNILTKKIAPLSGKLRTKVQSMQDNNNTFAGINNIQSLVKIATQEFVNSTLEKYQAYIVLKSGEINPIDIEKFVGVLKQQLLGNNFTKDAFEGWVKDYYKKEHMLANNTIVKKISNNLSAENYPDYSAVDTSIMNAREGYRDFSTSTYKLAHDQEYTMSWFQDGLAFLNEVLEFKGLGEDVSELTLIKKTVNIFDSLVKAFKGFKTTISGVLVYHRYSANANNENAVKEYALWAMDIFVSEKTGKPISSVWNNISQVYAEEEVDLLKKAYQHDSIGSGERDMLLEFTDASIDKDFYTLLIVFTEALAELDPNNVEIQASLNHLKKEQEDVVEQYNTLTQEIDTLNLDDRDIYTSGKKGGNQGNMNFSSEDQDFFIGMGVFLVIYVFIIYLIRKYKILKTLLIILGIIFVIMIFIGYFM